MSIMRHTLVCQHLLDKTCQQICLLIGYYCVFFICWTYLITTTAYVTQHMKHWTNSFEYCFFSFLTIPSLPIFNQRSLIVTTSGTTFVSPPPSRSNAHQMRYRHLWEPLVTYDCYQRSGHRSPIRQYPKRL